MIPRIRALVAALLTVGPLPLAKAQVPVGRAVQMVDVNSDIERYLRVLQLLGKTAPYTWSVRELGPSEVRRLLPADTAHPWGARVHAPRDRNVELAAIAPNARVIENTTFPYGFNEGPVWAGRGVTGAASTGFFARVRWFSLTVEPTVFRAQNQAFNLAPNGQSGAVAYGDLDDATRIDKPRRFGDSVYQRLDPGQSAIRAELPVVALGFSTANQHWGPAIDHPLILGNNAPGFPHVYVGTRGPLDLWLLKLDLRTEVGRLDQSAFSPVPDSTGRRMMTGVVASITARGLPGLELGGTRFYHRFWPADGPKISNLSDPLHGFFGSGGLDTANQILSVFTRAVFPSSHVEVYGEYARDDANIDRRDLTLEPDHISGYVLGLQKAWISGLSRVTVLRAEVLNTRMTSLQFGRDQAPFYRHGVVRQGHTERGVVLGSAAAFGGSGAVLALDRYEPSGKWTLSWDRLARSQGTALPPRASDVDLTHSLSLRRLQFGRHVDWDAAVAVVREFNREFTSDATNIRIQLGATIH
jgi:hypothetical protein